MCDPVLRQRIEEALEEINELKEISPPLPDDWELALELGEDDETGKPICSYYFVCHFTRSLFWLHEFDPESAMANLRGVTEWTHIREFSLHHTKVRSAKRVTRPGIAGPILVRALTWSCRSRS